MKSEARIQKPEKDRVLLLAFVSGFWLWAGAAGAQSLCEGNDYQRGLCAYRAGDYAEAARLFNRVVGAGAKEPETIKSHYFLARALMKQRQWQAAADQLIRIYGLSRSFYDEWNCDFLLGECRRALGRD